jgi:hypothetical protein
VSASTTATNSASSFSAAVSWYDEAAKNIFLGSGVVVLDKSGCNASLCFPQFLIEALKEETALIAEHLRLNNQHLGD